MTALKLTKDKEITMDRKELICGLDYTIKYGKDKIRGRIIHRLMDGKTYYVDNLRTGKSFFIKGEKAFLSFWNENMKNRYEDIVSGRVENRDLCYGKIDGKIMEFNKCMFVRAMARAEYDYQKIKTVLDVMEISMSEDSLQTQISLGKNKEMWNKHKTPFLMDYHRYEIDLLLLAYGRRDNFLEC